MKLARVIRKAAPFLLIAILMACLFTTPQKEGMKAFTEVDDLSHNTNQYTEHIREQPKAYSHNIEEKGQVMAHTSQKVFYRLYDQEEVEDVGLDFHDHDQDPAAEAIDKINIHRNEDWGGDGLE
jgi:hypothetical protein